MAPVQYSKAPRGHQPPTAVSFRSGYDPDAAVMQQRPYTSQISCTHRLRTHRVRRGPGFRSQGLVQRNPPKSRARPQQPRNGESPFQHHCDGLECPHPPHWCDLTGVSPRYATQYCTIMPDVTCRCADWSRVCGEGLTAYRGTQQAQ